WRPLWRVGIAGRNFVRHFRLPLRPRMRRTHREAETWMQMPRASMNDRTEIGVVAVAPRGRQVRPLRRLGLFVLVALTAGTIGWIGADRLRSPADLAAERAAPEPTPILAEVERRALTATVVARGSIQFAETRPVALAGPVGDSSITRQIATQLPSVGDVIENGSVLAEISGRPVIALVGATPRYRSTVRNAAGPDIRQ